MLKTHCRRFEVQDSLNSLISLNIMYKSEILGVANDIHKRYLEKIINMLVISEYMTKYVAEHLQISKWLTVVV